MIPAATRIAAKTPTKIRHVIFDVATALRRRVAPYAMEVSCQVNTKGFEAACGALAKISGKSIEDVVTSELGKVIDKTIQYTPASTISKLRTEFEKANWTAQPQSLYTPTTTRGRQVRAMARKSDNGKLFYDLRHRYPATLWNRIVQRRKESLKRKISAIGLAKKSWWSIAQALGLPVKSGRFVSAIGIKPEDFSVSKSIRATDIAVAFINAQPTVNVPEVGGARALQGAINGRVKYFLVNVQKGAFDSLQTIARQYPGLKLSQ